MISHDIVGHLVGFKIGSDCPIILILVTRSHVSDFDYQNIVFLMNLEIIKMVRIPPKKSTPPLNVFETFPNNDIKIIFQIISYYSHDKNL